MPSPLHETLRAEFLRRIEDGRWPEGSPIPSESRLCEEFGVSRGPVRQALSALREGGHVSGGQGRPPVVIRAASSQSIDVFVSFSEWAQSAGREPGQRTLELSRRIAGETLAEALRVGQDDNVVTLLRQRLLDGEPAMVERTAFVEDVGRLLFDFDPDRGSIFRHLSEQGVTLEHAAHVIDAVGADAVDADLLGVPVGAPLLRERRTTYDADNRVVEFSDDRYLPDRANFVVTNRRTSTSRLGLSPVHPD